MARLTTETTVANGGLTWQAEEVYLDAVGAVVAKVGGFLWTDDNPVFTLNAATALDVIMVSQAGRPAIDPDPAKRYWFGNPGGGGGGGTSMYRFLVNNDFNIAIDTPNNGAVSLVSDNRLRSISPIAIVRQKKFFKREFLKRVRLLYGIDYSGGGYLLDPFIAGIGGS